MDTYIMPTTELMLPETGCVVVLNKYLTTGQSRELQRILLGQGTIDTTKRELDSLNAASVFDMQDKAVLMLVKEVKKDGVSTPFTKEWLDSLPPKDGNLIFNTVNELVQASQMTEESKKK
jgi:hypothetical protein